MRQLRNLWQVIIHANINNVCLLSLIPNDNCHPYARNDVISPKWGIIHKYIKFRLTVMIFRFSGGDQIGFFQSYSIMIKISKLSGFWQIPLIMRECASSVNTTIIQFWPYMMCFAACCVYLLCYVNLSIFRLACMKKKRNTKQTIHYQTESLSATPRKNYLIFINCN